MYGSSITTFESKLRSIFADSDAFLIRCIAIGLSVRSIFVCSRNSSMTKSMIRLSKSTPPRNVSPPVASTSITFPCNCRTLTSNVPPPRS